MRALFVALLLFSCTKEQVVSTGCWTGVKDGKRQLIGCYTQQQIVAAEQSQSWAYLLDQYSDLKYESNVTCLSCEQKYK